MFDFKKNKKNIIAEIDNQKDVAKPNDVVKNFPVEKTAVDNFDLNQIKVHAMPEKFLISGFNKIASADSGISSSRKEGIKKNLLIGVIIGILVIMLFALASWFLLKSIETPVERGVNNMPAIQENVDNGELKTVNTNTEEFVIEPTCSAENCELCNPDECVKLSASCHTEDLCVLNGVSADAVCPQIVCKSGSFVNETQELPELKPGNDTDQDGLTDVEENLWSTDLQKKDTDGDSYDDGKEVLNLYSPSVAGSDDKAKLFGAGQIKSYTNTKFGYSLFYPASWQVNDFGDSGEQVVFISNSGEFFEVIVSKNDGSYATIKDWYQAQNPASDSSSWEEVLIGNWSGIKSQDKLNVYLLKNNYIYALSYNVGLKQELNYQTTFNMVLKSFQLFETPL